ncbi:MAG: ABC transporter permease [Candidatus Sericytochromatia bacterium]
MDPALQLGPLHLALAALLLGVQLLLSQLLQLGLGRHLLWASLRMVVQLSLLGLVLTSVFALRSLPLVLAVLCVMTLAAGQNAVSRVKHHYQGLFRNGLVAVWLSSWLTTAYMLSVVQTPDPWFRPDYVIPLLGMVLGNGLSGIALGLERFLDQTLQQREHIEAALALGANRWEAGRDMVSQAVRTGLTPITQSMMASGLVSLPGMMTGQILGGVSPRQAVYYQIVVMFLIATSTALGTMGVVLLSFFRLFCPQHRLRLDRLESRPR